MTKQIPVPRTIAVCEKLHALRASPGDPERDGMAITINTWAEHAAQLERELAEALADNKRLQGVIWKFLDLPSTGWPSFREEREEAVKEARTALAKKEVAK